MKNLRKFLSVALVLAMVLALSVTALADDETPAASEEAAGTYTITAPSNGHTYEIYQIFTGDLNDGTLSNIEAGTNYKGSNAAADAKTLAAVTGTDAEKLAEIEKYVDLTGTPAYTVASGASVKVPAGYYLIKDVDGSQNGKDDAYTLYLAKIVGDTTITPKTGTPKLEKKVQDTNDTTGETSGWQDSADYDIGDTIPYQLTATMGDLSAYTTYYVEFTDTMTHLTYVDGSVKVTVNGTDKTSAFTASWDASAKVLTVKCADVIAQGAVSGCKIVVTYSATLDSDAAVGSAGNPNVADLTYSNNPNNSGDGTGKPDDTGKTPTDKNIVFTYKVVANKVDGSNQPLSGAKFELSKKNAEGEYVSLGEIEQTEVKDADGNVTGYTFAWNGIDDGDYRISETQTPAGFNTIKDIEFTVTAEHDVLADDPTLTTLTGGNVFSGDVATGAVSADIVNESGSVLPTTGGIGTTIFYVLGGLMVLAAGIILVVRRKVSE